MRKIIFICMLLFPLSIIAQDLDVVNTKPKFERGHEIKISYGYRPFSAAMFACGCSQYYYNPYEYGIGESLTNPSTNAGGLYNIGAFALGYNYRFKKWFELGGTVSYNLITQNTYQNLSGEKIGRNLYHSINVMPKVKFNYFNNGLVALYGSLSVGLRIALDETLLIPTFNLNYFGLSVGRKVYWHLDLNIGNQGIFSTGVGVRI